MKPLILSAVLALTATATANEIDYSRDIRPVLASNCFTCHGPDEATREADLRLDLADAATAQRRAGAAIMPGDSGASLLVQRILADDPIDRMPPPESANQLEPTEIELLRQWIDAGAKYEPHWAFQKPERPALPEVADAAWPRNPIDRFILARLEQEGLAPSAEADPYTLARRVYLDLTGLPPTPAEVDVFVNDTRPDAYDRLVDRLLASPHFGERWTRVWMDLARYADTKGYEKDDRRTMWPYRDWLIDAFNADMPFDEFTIRQLAGDLLPDAGDREVLATAFHRNTMTNDEGGTDDEEFRVAAIVDRVNTTMTVWMGMTMGCAQCHSHKYDPISHEEYYGFFAFLNQTQDADRNPETPFLPVPDRERKIRLAMLDIRHEAERDKLNAAHVALAEEQAAWEAAAVARDYPAPAFGHWHMAGPFETASFQRAFREPFPPERNVDLAAAYNDGAIAWTAKPKFEDGKVHSLSSADNAATYLHRKIATDAPQPLTLLLGSDDGVKVWLNGNEVLAKPVKRGARADDDRVVVDLVAGENALLMKIVNSGGPSAFVFRAETNALANEIVAALKTPRAERTATQQSAIDDVFIAETDSLRALRDKAAAVAKEREGVDAGVPKVPVLRALPEDQRRTTHRLERGSFLSPKEEVAPDVPSVFNPFPEDLPRNRLGLAKWLVSPENPLTARVTVNRFWEQFFGTGIVETAEDFGTQGALPTHPKLLDWLAVEFVEDGWSMKRLCKRIVMSATYRQSSRVRPDVHEIDPYNRVLARGPRIRLAAETVRDNALAASGLLSDELHGPPVMPYQPDGVWQVVYSGDQWRTSEGDDKYRRGLYTFWRRTSPYPSMVTFDAPSREVCTARRIRTNTPLQALVTLNDPVYVEAAQALARTMIETGGAAPADRAAYGFRRVLARPPRDYELDVLTDLYVGERAHYSDARDAAVTMATVPLGPLPNGADPVEYAAWTIVANALLNLDEALTKR